MQNRTHLFFLLLIVLTVLSASGCATVISGKSQEMTFTSVPDEATVSINGRVLGKTPLTVQLERDTKQAITFEKEGYKPQTMALTTTLNNWFWGNILLLYAGPFGSTTDGSSGAMNEYSPSQYNVTLSPKDGRVQPVSTRKNEAKTFIISSYKNLLEDLNKGAGQYLDSLYYLLGITKDKQEEALQNIRRLSKQFSDIPTFAERTTNEYMR